MRYLTPQQNRLMRWRARILAGILAVVCFGGLLVRLFLLQVVDRDGYAARAADQQLRGATLGRHAAGGQRDLLDHPGFAPGTGRRTGGAGGPGAERDPGD